MEPGTVESRVHEAMHRLTAAEKRVARGRPRIAERPSGGCEQPSRRVAQQRKGVNKHDAPDPLACNLVEAAALQTNADQLAAEQRQDECGRHGQRHHPSERPTEPGAQPRVATLNVLLGHIAG